MITRPYPAKRDAVNKTRFGKSVYDTVVGSYNATHSGEKPPGSGLTLCRAV